MRARLDGLLNFHPKRARGSNAQRNRTGFRPSSKLKGAWAHVVCIRGVQLLFALACLTGGCLSRPHLQSQLFSFEIMPHASPSSPSPAHVLSIRRLRVAAPFEGQSFVYRTGEFSYERDPYAGFLVPPAESLAEPLKTYFGQSGIFGDVVEPGSALEPDIVAEINVVRLNGDFRSRANPASVLQIHFTFVSAANKNSSRILLDKEYSKEVSLQARTAAAVMTGWNKGLTEILDQVCKDLKARGI